MWIFQITSDLQVGTGVKVLLSGGAEPRSIFWQVGSSAVIETFAEFKGIIMADQSITMNTGSTIRREPPKPALGPTPMMPPAPSVSTALS